MPANPNIWKDMTALRELVAKQSPSTRHIRSDSFVGPDNLTVPFEINKNIGREDDNELIPDYGARYVRIGNLAFLDHRLRTTLPDDLLEAHKDSIVWLSRFRSVFCEPSHLQFSPLTIHALASQDLKGKHVLDLGTADGVLSMTAIKMGADKVTSVELHPQYFPYYAQHQRVNGFDETRMEYIFGDLAQPGEVLPEISEPSPTIAVANIGPWYGNAHLDAIKLAAQIPTVKTFISGAYIKTTNWQEKNPGESIELLKSLGFKRNYREIVFDGVNLTFMLDRT